MSDIPAAAVELMDVSHLLEHVVKHTWTMLVTSLPKFVAALIIFFFFMILARVIDKAMFRLSQRTAEVRAPVIHLLRNIIRNTLYIVGAITALGSVGVEVSALVTSLGLSGVAVSFALKDSLSNTVAGIMVMLYQPFKLGNTIQVGSDEGKVTSINIRYTHLIGPDDTVVIIPNSKMLTETIRIPKKHRVKAPD